MIRLQPFLLPDARFISATVKSDGSPDAKEIDMDVTFKKVAHKDNTRPIPIEAVKSPNHLELSLRLPFFPPAPSLAPYKMVITLLQTSVVWDTPGLTIYTSDARDPEHFHECILLDTPQCDFLCICYKDVLCTMYVRLEWPAFGNWGMPQDFTKIEYRWAEHREAPEVDTWYWNTDK